MSQPSTRPERIQTARADDPRDIVHRAVACLAHDGLVLLPAQGQYILAASALQAMAVERLAEQGDRALWSTFPLTLPTASSLDDWVPEAPSNARRLAARCWPGPLILNLRNGSEASSLVRHLPPVTRRVIGPDPTCLGLACPARSLLPQIQKLIAGPLILAPPRGGAADPAAQFIAVEGLTAIDMVLDAGPCPEAPGFSVIEFGDSGWSLIREGELSHDDIQHRLSVCLLFVCTGNTCRSPMAEALCREVLARRLGCEPHELPQRGYHILSAGVTAGDGHPAAPYAVDVVADRGGSLRSHQSQRLDEALVQGADWVIAMTAGHLACVAEMFPEAIPRMRLLSAWGDDIDDPIGADRATYVDTARSIEQHIEALMDELGIPLP